jgi:hypothetical protein
VTCHIVQLMRAIPRGIVSLVLWMEHLFRVHADKRIMYLQFHTPPIQLYRYQEQTVTRYCIHYLNRY